MSWNRILLIAVMILIILVGGGVFLQHQIRLNMVKQFNDSAMESLFKDNSDNKLVLRSTPAEIAAFTDEQLAAKLVGRWRRELLLVKREPVVVEIRLARDGKFHCSVVDPVVPAEAEAVTGTWSVKEHRLIITPARSEHPDDLKEVSELVLSLQPLTTFRWNGTEVISERIATNP